MENQKAENYILVLTELEKAISEGDIDNFKELSNLISHKRATWRDYYSNSNNPFRNTNLVIIASRYNKVKILENLFDSDSRILNDLSTAIKIPIIRPDDEDEACHNAFYYAIRSGNIELLETLMNKWPDNYFALHLEELDKILSRAYEELKFKNLSLSDEMEIFVENKIINLRFFSNASPDDRSSWGDLNNIRDRIELILQNISFLKTDYSNPEKVDTKFLFVAKTIAQNIHTLKRQLKSTYVRLPWEEMEFCLVNFVSSYTKRQESNLFYRATLNKSKILYHLENFGKKLKEEKVLKKKMKDTEKLSYLPKVKREKVVAEIISSYPPFEDLYKDYREVRDIHSLGKMRVYVNLALSIDPSTREGQLIITRAFQVIGELLKNTLESPNLSNTTSELFLLTLSKKAREIIVGLRNSISHADSLSKRTTIQENTDVNFFINVQNDIKKVADVIIDIFYNNNIKTLRILLTKIANSKSFGDILEVCEILSNAEFEVDKMMLGKFKMLEFEKLAELIKELNDYVVDKTKLEEELFKKINGIIDCAGTPKENIRFDYMEGFTILKGFSMGIINKRIDDNVIRGIKFRANHTLKSMASNIEPHNLKEIAKLSRKISCSVESRIEHDDDKLDNIKRINCKIFYIAELGTGDIKWIEELREKLNEKGSFNPRFKPNKAKNVIAEKYNNQLPLKLSELKSFLSSSSLSGSLMEKISSYKNDKKLQALVEMFVLDIMSILGSSKPYLENNLLFLDDNTPLLSGKCLRNYLAHGNPLLDVSLFDSSAAVILNAAILAEENLVRSKKKIGKLVSNDSLKLRITYNQGLATIADQETMFVALEEGNLESLKNCLKKGSDIYARNINLWTTLHFAAKGSSLEVVKFVLDQNLSVNVKDIDGQSPLYIAAAHGRKNIVEFFVEELHLNVNDRNNAGKTPLHVSAQKGHKEVVEVLLKNNANTIAQDAGCFPPLHYAILNNHVDIAKILLKKDVNVNINEAVSGFTPLSAAAEGGNLEIVNFLLQNNANVNLGNDRNWTPLHAAAYNGYLEIVNALIIKGADVKATVINGCTSLLYAVESGHEKIANILLKHGANVNAVNKTQNSTPLHTAAACGFQEIVNTLLKNKANTNIATVHGITPLHLAVGSGHFETAATLLKHGANIHFKDKIGHTPLHYAVASGHKVISELLIRNGAEINTNGNNGFTPLHVAAFRGHTDVADLLIRNKAKINVKFECGTPLYVAAVSGSKDIIALLIKHNAEVNITTTNGLTPLHEAALNGHRDATVVLLKNKADLNIRDNDGRTPLHAAVLQGHKDIVNLLIQNKAEVDVKDIEDSTPLLWAVEAGHKEIVEILVTHGANINFMDNDKLTPLLSAIRHNHNEIVEVLIKNGANVNEEGSKALLLAVGGGYRDTVDLLLNNKACVNMKNSENVTPLYLAAAGGHKKIVDALLTRGANVDAVNNNNVTPLSIASEKGYQEVVEILIAGGANVNVKCKDGLTPLHLAAGNGHNNVVKILLLNKAIINVTDNENRTPVEFAVSNGNLEMVKMLLQAKRVDMNSKGNDDYTILHIASQQGHLEMVKYLIDQGSNIAARNAHGSKPIHIACREGHQNIVEFFLSMGLSVNDLGAFNQTLIYYASMKGHVELVKYLIAEGADLNVKDTKGLTAIHIAAFLGHKDVIEILLKNGAAHNAVDYFLRSPIHLAKNEDVISLLASTEALFNAVRYNNSLEVEYYIQVGAIVDAKNIAGVTPLHYAAWKGYDKIVNVLLHHNNGNPNVVNKMGWTPLHYAARYSHFTVVKLLLSNYAVYNAVSDSSETPLDLTVDKSIASFLKLVNKLFESIKNGNPEVINELNKIKDVDTIKAIMRARNREKKTLVVVAVLSNFSHVQELKQISQDDISVSMYVASVFQEQGQYQRALIILKSIFEKRKEILGLDNPGTLDIQTNIADVLYSQGAYQEALNTYEDIFQKQKEILGLNEKDTLNTRSGIALVLHRLGRNEEALNIFREVLQKQTKLLGSNHSDTLGTQFHMALTLTGLGKCDEALNINKEIFEKRKKMSDANDPNIVYAQNNIALVLTSQGNYEEALKIYEEVLEKKKVLLGINHRDTLRTLQNIAAVLSNQNKHQEALKAHQEVLNIQEDILGPNHPDTLHTQYSTAMLLYKQKKWIGALKAFRKCLNPMKVVFGPNYPDVLNILKIIELLNMMFKIDGTDVSEILEHLQKDINIAASTGEIQTVKSLLQDGIDPNDKDADGRTPLHFAVSNGHIGVVLILLKNGADATRVTNKGNTTLHIATSKCYKEIVEVLLQHVNQDKLYDFVNSKTTATGTASLHIAANNGSLDVTKSLLKRGAIYDIKNDEGKTPLHISKKQDVTNLLKLVEKMFGDARKGNVEIISKLRAVKPDEFETVTNARNNQGKTLLEVAKSNKHMHIASKLSEMLKKPDQNVDMCNQS